jgi:pSer/pThr/pTyr-binding forkhead associated (FHA) protein
MPTYVAEYAEELRKLGPDRFQRLYAHPVFIVQGLAGTLKEQRSTGTTVVAQINDVVQLGSLVGRVFPVQKSKYSPPGPTINVGRTADNDLAIPEYSISKRHCFLAKVGDEVRLTDLGSTNGTLVDGVQVDPKKPIPLKGGEVVTIGRFALLYQTASGFAAYLKTVA